MNFLRPTSGNMTGYFGAPRAGHTHEGVDIAAPTGTEIIATAAGRVTHAGWLNGNAGNAVKISHGAGIESKYFHCSRVQVSAGQQVGQGQVIAAVGATGNAQGAHLHFEIHVNGRAVDPVPLLNSGLSVPASNAPLDLPQSLSNEWQNYLGIGLAALALLLIIVRR